MIIVKKDKLINLLRLNRIDSDLIDLSSYSSDIPFKEWVLNEYGYIIKDYDDIKNENDINQQIEDNKRAGYPIIEIKPIYKDRVFNRQLKQYTELKKHKFQSNYNLLNDTLPIPISLNSIIPNSQINKVVNILKSKNNLKRFYFDSNKGIYHLNFIYGYIKIEKKNILIPDSDFIITHNDTTFKSVSFFIARKSFLNKGKSAKIICNRNTGKSEYKLMGDKKIMTIELKNFN